MQTKLLTDQQFRFTFGRSMRNISGREHIEQPEGVLDLQPYLAAIPAEEFGSAPLLESHSPSAVYRNDSGGYDHVLYPCARNNHYLVVVVAFREHTIVGHAFLDLAAKYSLDR